MLEHFSYSPDPENPGWFVRPKTDHGRFLDVYGEMRITAESETVSRLRLIPAPEHRNINGTVQGGFLMAVIDHALFAGPTVQGRANVAAGSTIDMTTQFLAPVEAGEALDVIVETLRETYRMIFVRGTVEQRGTIAIAFSGTIKKASATK